jgi:hypothetical protein
VAAVADALGIASFAVLGMSLGGPTAHVPGSRLLVVDGTAHLSTLHARWDGICAWLRAVDGPTPTG